MRDLIELSSNTTIQHMLERDMFQKRISENRPIHLHEFLCPIFQGFDSVALDAAAAAQENWRQGKYSRTTCG